MSTRVPLSVEQVDKVVLISRWLFKLSVVQLDIQSAHRWDLLEELRLVFRSLSHQLVLVVGERDGLEGEDWEEKLLLDLFKTRELIAAHKATVDADFRGTLRDLFGASPN